MTTPNPLDPADGSPTKKPTRQFVGFQVGEQDFAFRIEHIQEIVQLRQVTRMPQVAPYVEGVANLRGSIIPVINLRRLLGMEAKTPDGDTRTIVANVGSRIMGCTVDTVSQVMRIPEESIQPAPESVTAGTASYIQGFARVDERLIILLDIDQLLDPARLQDSGATELPDRPRGT